MRSEDRKRVLRSSVRARAEKLRADRFQADSAGNTWHATARGVDPASSGGVTVRQADRRHERGIAKVDGTPDPGRALSFRLLWNRGEPLPGQLRADVV